MHATTRDPGDGTGPVVTTWRPRAVVVNDDRTQLRVLEGLLEAEGLRVLSYGGAEEALRELDPAAPPDLIVTDLYMPGIDGWRFCRLLRSPEYSSFNGVPILVVSATFSGEDAAEITLRLGANAFVPCPVEPVELGEKVRRLLKGEAPKGVARVLVVEDAEDQARALVEGFRLHGYEARSVGTGAEGLAALEARSHEVVVLDYHLPDASGDELLDECHRLRPEAVVVMITGDPRPELAVGWMKRGASAYVRKPFELGYLLQLCENARRERALLRVEDLLERRTRELREQAEVHRIVADFTHNWEYWLTPQGTVRYVSPSCERVTGYPASAFVGSPGLLLDLVHADDRERVRQHFREESVDHEGVVELEFRIRTQSGEVRWIGHVCAPVHDAEGVYRGVRVSNRDLTDQKRAEEARWEMERRLWHAQKLESLGLMAGGIAHDFNNLLTAIMGNLDLAMEEAGGVSAGRECLQHAMQASHRAADLTRQLLAYAGKARFEPRAMDIGELVKANARLIRMAIPSNVRLELELGVAVPSILADPVQMQQVVMNLITNAAESYGGGPGVVTVATGRVECDRGTLMASRVEEVPPPGHYVFVEVRDVGCGMDAETQQRLFDPFFTTKFMGRGLGMSSGGGIVRGHRGAVFVESGVGRGTAVRVLFPVPVLPAGGGGREGQAGHGRGGGGEPGGIWVVDDEDPVRELCTRIVQGLGYRAVGAADGEEAIRLLASLPGAVRCVVLDLTMPRLGGVETFRRMKAMRPGLRVILSSGYPESEATKEFAGEGLAGFLQKPYQPRGLRDAIERVMRQPLEGGGTGW